MRWQSSQQPVEARTLPSDRNQVIIIENYKAKGRKKNLPSKSCGTPHLVSNFFKF